MKRMLVVHTWGIGDWLFFTPALRVLLANYPELTIDVLLGTPSTRSILDYYGKRVRVLGVADTRRAPWQALLPLFRNFKRRYDAALFTAGTDSRKADLLALFIRANKTLALTTGRSSPRFLDLHKPYDYSKHRIDNNMELIGLLGLSGSENRQPYLHHENGKRVKSHSVLIHPGCDARSSYKRWPTDRFAQVALELLRRGFEVSVVLGPSEHQLMTHFGVVDANPRFAIHRDLPLCNVIDLIAEHDLTLHSDSGIGHIAAALGKGSIAIVGPADPVATRPIGARVEVIRLAEPLECQPCIRPGGRYGCNDRPCLQAISVSDVVKWIENATHGFALH